MRKGQLFIALALALQGCAPKPKVHRDFEANHYISGFSTYLFNKRLGANLRSFGDIEYVRNRHELDSLLAGVPVNNVLFYGKTTLSPHYEIYVLANPGMRNVDTSAFELVLDTTLNRKRFVFLGNGLGEPFPERDFRFISASLKAGKGLPDGAASLSEVLLANNGSANFLKSFRDIADYPVMDRADRGIQLQYELTYLSMLGDNARFREKLAQWEGRYAVDEDLAQRIATGGTLGGKQVKARLLKLTAGEQLVMFSENHFYPWHRILVRELLPSLKEQGFGYLALEALATDSVLNAGGAPELSIGFYTREQQYYRLLRTAQKLGFEFVSYDQMEGVADRESAQAENLYRKTFAKDPDARVVVLAGIDHIAERPHGDRVRMAQLFREQYGVDPLTVSQTDLAVYRNVLESDLALIPADSLDRERYRRVDLQLVNNLGWEVSPGEFRYHNQSGEPLQLALYNAAGWKSDFGYIGDIPEITTLLLPGESFSAELPDGAYQLLLFNREGEVLRNEPAPDHVNK